MFKDCCDFYLLFIVYKSDVNLRLRDADFMTGGYLL